MTHSRTTPCNGKIQMVMAGAIITIGLTTQSKTWTILAKPLQSVIKPAMHSPTLTTNGPTWMATDGATTKPVSINQMHSHSNHLSGMTLMVMAMAITVYMIPMAMKDRSSLKVHLNPILVVKNTANQTSKNTDAPTAMLTVELICMTHAHGTQRLPTEYSPVLTL